MSQHTINMPQLSDTMTEGVLVSWEKAAGDAVSRGDIVATVETDKAIMDVEVFREGYLSGPFAPVDAVVEVGQPIAYLVASEDAVSAEQAAPTSSDAQQPAPESSAPVPPRATSQAEGVSGEQDGAPASEPTPERQPVSRGDTQPAPRPDNQYATPYARKLAAERQVNLNAVAGRHGVIQAGDVAHAQPVERPRQTTTPTPAHELPEVQVAGEGRAMSAMERAVAHNMTAALTLPTFNMIAHVQPQALQTAARRLEVSFTVAIAKACAEAIGEHPVINRCYQPVDRIVERARVDVGMAVATEDGGLVVPVLRQVEARDLETLNGEWQELMGRARQRRLTQEEYANATFQISNLGMYGVEQFNAIPMPGLGAILAIAATHTAGMPLTLTVDHRVINGAQAAEFLQTLRAKIAQPEAWLGPLGPAIPEGDWDHEVIVIGAGPGGEDCARELAARGISVAMVDTGALPGGECLWRGCIPSKTWRAAADRLRDRDTDAHLGIDQAGVPALDWSALEATRREILAQRGRMARDTDSQVKIETYQGQATLVGEHRLSVDTSGNSDDPFQRATGRDASQGQRLAFGAAVIATGAPPAIPPIDGLPEAIEAGVVLTSDTVWRLPFPPKRLAVIGAGAIGTEMAQMFADFGSQVELFELQRRILPEVEAEVASGLAEILANQSTLALHTGAAIQSVQAESGQARVRYQSEEQHHEVSVDRVLLATGKRPTLEGLNLQVAGLETAGDYIKVDKAGRTSVPHIFAVGDVVGGLMLAHTAAQQGRIAAAVLAGEDRRYDASQDCGVIFTRPQAGFVGLSSEQAKANGLDAVEIKAPLSIDALATIHAETQGFIKLVADRPSRRVLGVHFLADHTAALIGEAAMMVSAGLTLDQVAHAIHPHPTQTELLGELARRLLARVRRGWQKSAAH